jgi:hypothetical protein
MADLPDDIADEEVAPVEQASQFVLFGCGPGLLTYAVSGPGAGAGVRCVQLRKSWDGSTFISWYGEGWWGSPTDFTYRHVGEAQLGTSDWSELRDIYGNGEHAQNVIRDFLPTPIGGEVPSMIAVSGSLNETWYLTSGTHPDYVSVFSRLPARCGPNFHYPSDWAPAHEYRGTPSGTAEEGVRCLMPSGLTWYGAGYLNGPNGPRYQQLGFISYENDEWRWGAANICYASRICDTAPFGSIDLVREGYFNRRVVGRWAEFWIEQ